MISNQKIAQLFKTIGYSVVKSEIAGKGEASVVIKVETHKGIYALKTALYPKRREKILREASFRSFFIDHGLTCIPQPIYLDRTIFPNGAVIYDFIEGRKPENFSVNHLKQFAKIISEIHGVKYEIIDDGYSQIQKTAQFLDKIIKKISSNYPHLLNPLIDEAFAKAQAEFQKLCDQNKEYFTIGISAQLHGDLSDNFVVDSNEKIWLIDWENSEYGDVLEELYWFLYVNNIPPTERKLFYTEYQKWFKPAHEINLIELELLYYAPTPVFNICWGLDQLDLNLKLNLEPERKLRDLAKSAGNWTQFYTKETSDLIANGIKKLTKTIS